MQYKAYLYVFFTLLSAFALSGVNFDRIIKNNRIWEARILVMILSCIGGYLLTNFITDFITASQIL